MTVCKSLDNSKEEAIPIISKSQQKRELSNLRDIAQQLINLPEKKIRLLGVEEITDAVLEAKKITKTNAKKRQVQYIAKLIHKSEPQLIEEFKDLFNHRSAKKKQQRIEQWRHGLLTDKGETFSTIVTNHPNVNRQYLQQLVRKAALEEHSEQIGSTYKKLFQFLKEIDSH